MWTRESTTTTAMTLCVAGCAILNLFNGAAPCCHVQANPFGATRGALHYQHHQHQHSSRMRLRNPTVTWNEHPSSSWNSVLPMLQMRGGSSSMATEKENDDEDETEKLQPNDDDEPTTTTLDITKHADFAKLQSYRMQQQILMQHRATILSEYLAKRGIPLPTLIDVATPEGVVPPQKVDWDCAMSTSQDLKTCLYSFDAQVGTKVVAPIDNDKWITLAALNRLRRTDPSKVEPMWFNQWAILESWFNAESEYSLLQHVGMGGLLLNFVLEYNILYLLLGMSLIMAAIICMPILEYVVNRVLVSGLVWVNWHSWARFVHAALPLKLLLGQMTFKLVGTLFLKLVHIVRERLVEVECQILERCIPLTVGPGSEDDKEDSEMDVVLTGWDEEEDDTTIVFDNEDGGDEFED